MWISAVKESECSDMTKKIKKLDKQIRFQKKLRKDARLIFENTGFILVPQQDINIDIKGQKSDLDNIFIFENLVVIAEDTIVATNPNDHLRKKAEFFKHCQDNKSDFIQFLKTNIPAYKVSSANSFGDSDIIIAFLYIFPREVDSSRQQRYGHLKFIDQKILSYFLSLSKTIKKSARFEMFKFLDIDFEKLGSQKSGVPSNEYTGLILPETPSGFPSGYKLVSFLIDPTTLLRQSYVLRKDGWLDNDFVYQRILVGNKIFNMRKYLTEEGRVFVNNVIVTLPDDVKLVDIKDKNKLADSLNAGAVQEPVKIQIPQKAGNIGIIDGQHRVFSYHEGNDIYENIISQIRDKQHLLVTGIIFPKSLKDDDRTRFQAKLFLEINDKQTRTNAALRQVIGTIVNPFEATSIAKMVVNGLAKRSPMDNVLEQHFFDKGKLKTTSIVSYGMKHITKLSGNDSFFHVWRSSKKNSLLKGNDVALLSQYIKFCADEMNIFLQAFKKNIPANLWTTDQKISRVLTATTVTGLVHCMKILIENKKRGDFDYYDKCFRKLAGKIDFTPRNFTYKSSHWKDLGDKIYEVCFK